MKRVGMNAVSKRVVAFIAIVAIIVGAMGFAVSDFQPSATSFCNFPPEVTLLGNQIRNLSGFIALEVGENYTLVSADQNGVETAYLDGTTLPNGTTSWARTIYYPPYWSLMFMPLPTYCTSGGSWVGVRFIRAAVPVDANGSFDLGNISLYHSTFLPNGTA
jgi:hypothetical protein